MPTWATRKRSASDAFACSQPEVTSSSCFRAYALALSSEYSPASVARANATVEVSVTPSAPAAYGTHTAAEKLAPASSESIARDRGCAGGMLRAPSLWR